VRKLRRATNLLAEGDLSVRVAAKMGRRRDELADLGRDFDKMAERLQHLLLSERRLLGDISHELRSPLARMNVALELAEQTANEDTLTYLHRIQRESGRLNELIGQLLALARLESGDTQNREEIINLHELIEGVAQDANFEAKTKKCGVVIVHNDEVQTIGNTELLCSALENVVRNAIRYTNEQTQVEVEQRREKGQSLIRVRDYGPGVPEEALPELFRPFYRVASARDRQSGGVGLGLAIAERAVRAHGGSISASNVPNGGLMVEMRLPLRTIEN
jgi:two-component system sensor histidine kinase CpxA